MTATAQKTERRQVLFMPKVFNETLNLLVDAREYFSANSNNDQSEIDEALKLLYSSEMSRITLRLSSIMAWIMAQRAVLAGSISHADAVKYYGLGYQDVCRVDNRMMQGILPDYVCHLLDRTLELYERVNRLDEQFKRVH